MAEEPAILLDAAEVARRVEAVAAEIAPRIDDETVVVCLLTGGLWFAADLTRALSRLGRNPLFDAMWLTSYGDERASGGRVMVRAGLQRHVEGRQVLIVDEVLDSGLTLRAAVKVVMEAGAARALTAVFARKPWPEPRDVAPDYVAWEAPARFLIGYGMDDSGRYRGWDGVGALD